MNLTTKSENKTPSGPSRSNSIDRFKLEGDSCLIRTRQNSRSVDGAVILNDNTHLSSPFCDPLIHVARKQLPLTRDADPVKGTPGDGILEAENASQVEFLESDNVQIELDPDTTYLEISTLQQQNNTINTEDKTPRGISHLRIGIGISTESTPHYAFALHDSGASDCLISVSMLHQLSDFDKLRMSAVQKTRIRAATGDESHPVHGKIALYITFNEKGKPNNKIQVKVPFYVVSGLTHDVFIGQSFLNSGWVHHETVSYTYLRPHLEFDTNYLEDKKLIKLYKYHAKTLPAHIKKEYHIPPGKHHVQLSHASTRVESDAIMYFYPNINAPIDNLHFVPQIIDGTTTKNHIIVVNDSNQPITLKRGSVVGTVNKTFTDNILVDELHRYTNYSTMDTNPVNLNIALKEFESNDFNIVELHRAMIEYDHESEIDINNASMYHHELTPEEKDKRNALYKKQGFFQKTVSEITNDLSGQPHLDYTRDEPKPKTDQELLDSCDLSHLSKDQQFKAKEMLKNRLSAFQRHKLDIGKCKDIVASAPLKSETTPNVVCKYIPIPLKYKEEAQKMIDKYVRAGVLKQTFESCPITSNMYLIPKPQNRGFRAVYDGRALSSVVRQLPTPMPTMEEMFGDWSNSTYLSVLDVVDAYHSIPIDDKTSKMMSFFAPSGARYVYLRLAQGLKFSSHFLNNAMDMILQPIRHHTKNYADDCICSSSGTFDDHLKKVDEVLERFIEYNIKVNMSKLKLATQEVDILGMTWKKGFLSIPDAKVQGYLNLAEPKNLKEAQFLINSLAYYRRFIPNFSELAFPIQELITKCRNEGKKHFTWSTKHQKATNLLISSLKHTTSIMLPKPDRKYIIHSDSSYEAVGGTVSQFDDDGSCRLVAAISRSFTQTERRHSAVIKEILGLIYILKSCQYFLRGSEIDIYADAKSISLIKSCSITSPYLARLSMELSQYEFSIHHIDGRINIVADALSRMNQHKHEILRIDKEDNDGMTLEEGLRFIELLKIPTGYKFSKEEVRQMINSAPLRSSLDKRVKRNLTSMQRAPVPQPVLVKDRPPKMPALLKKIEDHPHVRKNSSKRIEKIIHNTSRVRSRSADGKDSCPDELHKMNKYSETNLILLSSILETSDLIENNLTSSLIDNTITSESQVTPDDGKHVTQFARKILTPVYRPSTRSLFVNLASLGNAPRIATANSESIQLNTTAETFVPTNHMEILQGLKQLDIKCGIIRDGIISTKDFQDAQELDPAIRKQKEAFLSNPKLHYRIRKNILCRVKNGIAKPILPKSLENLLFSCMHFHAFSGHRSADTMIKAIYQMYHIENLEKKVQIFTRNCFICKTHKSQRMTKNLLGKIITPKRPREICSFDITGGFESSRHGYKYVYLFVDNFSLYCTSVLAKSKTEDELKRAFLTVLSQWSEIPKVMISDQEPGTLTDGMKEFFHSYGIEHKIGGAYSPHRNLCETAAVRKVKEFMRSIAAQTGVDWPEAVKLATICANQTPTAYGYTPSQMHYGDVRVPHALIEEVNPVKNLDDYISQCTKNHKKIEEKVNKTREEFNSRKRDAINIHREAKRFKPNDLVWVKSLKIVANRATKVQNKGPFIIISRVSESTYELGSLNDPETVISVQHANNLTRFESNPDYSPITFPQLDI